MALKSVSVGGEDFKFENEKKKSGVWRLKEVAY